MSIRTGGRCRLDRAARGHSHVDLVERCHERQRQFEFSYRDERFLPFEGAGAISEWRLELAAAIRSFDYATISDVLLHLHYIALDGGCAAAEANHTAIITAHAADPGLFRLISLRQELPDASARLTASPPPTPNTWTSR